MISRRSGGGSQVDTPLHSRHPYSPKKKTKSVRPIQKMVDARNLGAPNSTWSLGRTIRRQVKDAGRVLRRAIRKAKRDTWNNYLQEADQENMWKAVRYAALRESGACNALNDELGHTAITITEKEETIVRTASPPLPEDDGYQAPSGGTMHRQVNQQRAGKAIAGITNKNASSEDGMGAEIVKLLWDWGPSRITALSRGAIRTGYHPRAWKTARGIVIPKPG